MTLSVTQNQLKVNELILFSDLRIKQEGVDNDDDIDSGSLTKAKADNVEQCFLFSVEFTLFDTYCFTVFQCILTAYSHHRFVNVKDR